jgi:thiol-disulfide isomerase/thioredoxin
MTLRRLALPCLLLAVACSRDEPRGAASVTPPPPTTTPAIEDASPVSLPPGTTPSAAATPSSPPAEPPMSATVTIVELDAQAGPLEDQLAAIAARATREDRPATVEIWASWCPPCKRLDRLLAGGAVADALRGTILVRVDVDMFDDELNALGFTAPQIPSMYRLDGRGRPRGKPLSGADWTKRPEPEIAAALRSFLGS